MNQMTPPPEQPPQMPDMNPNQSKVEVDFDAYTAEMQQQIAGAMQRAAILAGENAALKRKVKHLEEMVTNLAPKPKATGVPE